MGENEVTQTQLDDLKDLMREGFDKLGKNIDELKIELKAQNKVIGEQGTEIARIKDKMESHSKKLDEHGKELQVNHDEILVNKTEHTASINQLKWIMAVVGFIITVITFLMKFWPGGN